ncbi:hypothetical protein ETAC_01270 [Edwardsiella piscicida C07-087]|nr:hypothetical protein ETAC_01270 [Edwardsiella piscicida C07-087]
MKLRLRRKRIFGNTEPCQTNRRRNQCWGGLTIILNYSEKRHRAHDWGNIPTTAVPARYGAAARQCTPVSRAAATGRSLRGERVRKKTPYCLYSRQKILSLHGYALEVTVARAILLRLHSFFAAWPIMDY